MHIDLERPESFPNTVRVSFGRIIWSNAVSGMPASHEIEKCYPVTVIKIKIKVPILRKQK